MAGSNQTGATVGSRRISTAVFQNSIFKPYPAVFHSCNRGYISKFGLIFSNSEEFTQSLNTEISKENVSAQEPVK